MPAIKSSPIKGYLVAVLSTSVVLIVRVAIADSIEDRVPFLLPMVVPVFLAAWYGGLKPGLLATFLGVVLGTALLSDSPGQSTSWMANGVRIAMFLVEGLAISASFEAMHKARKRLEKKQRELEEENRKRKLVEQELVTADRRKNEFLATLAHELRNPLAPICYGLEILNQAHDDAALQATTHSLIERHVWQMVRLVDDLLDMSRITRNKLEMRKERVDLATVLRNAVETSRPLIEASGQQLTTSLPSEPVLVDADPVRLAQVFSNLLNNAAKYTERAGQINLTVERQGSGVMVRVKDRGIGIPPDKLGSIFEMFMQVDRTLERSQSGLGIGLTLVKRLVEMHGGTVEAFSEGPGRGSEFVVRLPVLIETPKAKRPEPTSEQTQVSARRILIVDDNTVTASCLAKLLNMTGNETHTAYDGLEAVEAAERFRPDAILLDIGLPKLNGYDSCRRIREQPWGKKMVIVALTGWGQEDDHRKSKDAGFDAHMVKPVGSSAIIKLLAETPLPV